MKTLVDNWTGDFFILSLQPQENYPCQKDAADFSSARDTI